MAIDKDDSALLADRVNSFLSANRKIILGIVALIAVIVVGLAFYFSFSAKKKAEELASIEKIIFDLEKEKGEIEKKKKEAEDAEKKKNEENKAEETPAVEENVDEDAKDEAKEEKDELDPEIIAKEDEAIANLLNVANSSSGYASYLAFYNVADMYFARKDYAKAKDFYLKALQAEPNNYIAGVLFFNVAVCVEELAGDDAEALDYYQKSSKVEDFPLKPRSLFNVARVQEKLNHPEEAIATYQSLIEKYPDNDFAMMGKSRIIALEIKAKKE